MNQSALEEFINDIKEFYEISRSTLPEYIKTLTFDTLKSYITKTKGYVSPLPFELDIAYETRTRKGRTQTVPKSLQMYYFNLINIGLVLLRNEDTFNEIINETISTETDHYEKDIDGSKIKDRGLLPRFANEQNKNGDVTVVLRVLLYSDEFQVANALGAKTKNNKVTGIYGRLMNVRAKGKLNEIFPLAFINYKHTVDYDFDIVLRPVINELKRGLVPVTLPLYGRQVTFTFKLIGLTGDTLAQNTILGIMNGRANRFCRCCLIHRDDFEKDPNTKAEDRTDIQFANIKVELANPHLSKAQKDKIMSKWGLSSTKESILNELNLSPRENRIFDRFHDFLEGVTPLSFICIVRYFIELKVFTVDFLNLRIKHFIYGKLHISEAPSDNLTLETLMNVAATKLKQNGTQTHLLFRALPFLILDQVDLFQKSANVSAYVMYNEIERVIRFMSVHLEILQLVSSRILNEGQLSSLEELIVEHNQLYVKLFRKGDKKAPLINKLHFMTHYPRMIREYGPAVLLETTRFESYNKVAKETMKLSNNFLNVPKSISGKIAIKFSYEQSYGFKEERLQVLRCTTHAEADEIITTGDALKLNGVLFEKNMVLCISTEELKSGGHPEFAIISKVMHRASTPDDLIFDVMILETTSRTLRYGGYKVKQTKVEKRVELKGLPIKYPFTMWRTYGSTINNIEFIISLKTSELT